MTDVVHRAPPICAERAREVWSYNPDTGELRWRIDIRTGKGGNRISVPAGSRAGSLSDRYLIIRFERRPYKVHRVIWLMMTDAWPADHIDHIDGDGLNNRWANLRSATRFENMRNRGKAKHNTSGYKGVIWQRHAKLWRAQIGGSRRSGLPHRHLGYFNTPEEAHAAYCRAISEAHGSFANPGAPNVR